MNETPSDDSLSQARTGARHGEIHSEDLVFVEATSSPWDLMITPIGNARFGHWKEYLVTPSVEAKTGSDPVLGKQGVTLVSGADSSPSREISVRCASAAFRPVTDV